MEEESVLDDRRVLHQESSSDFHLSLRWCLLQHSLKVAVFFNSNRTGVIQLGGSGVGHIVNSLFM